MTKDLTIRNSTAEFLIFTAQSGEESIEVKYADGTVWLSQKLIAKLFDKGRSTITEHLNAIYSEGELDKNATCRNFRQVQTEGDRNIERDVEFYNLDAIISVGYRVNSKKATQFRVWATKTLKKHLVEGYTINEKRLLQANDKFRELQTTIGFLREKAKHELLIGQEQEILNLLASYSKTLTLLEQYDKEKDNLIKIITNLLAE